MYQFLGQAIENTTAQHIPRALESKGLVLNTNVNLAEVYNGVVNPLTNKTLTTYSKVINSPALHSTWLKAMCKELGISPRVTQTATKSM